VRKWNERTPKSSDLVYYFLGLSFGDHVRVLITKDGVDVEEYGHD